jgi:hypothetical protein
MQSNWKDAMSRRIIGLAVIAVLAMMALGAASAQAAPPNWLYRETSSSPLIELGSENIALEKDIMLTWSTTVGGTSVVLLCEDVTLEGGVIGAAGTGKGTLKFSKNCETKLNGVTNANCKPAEPIVFTFVDQLFLHNNLTYDLFSPEAGKTAFTTLHFSETCLLGEEVPIKGHIVVQECSPNDLETHLIKHLLEPAPRSLFQTINKYDLSFGVNAMALDGSVWLKLGGPHIAKEWDGIG